MAPLHNRISQKELKQRLATEAFSRVTFSFYRYSRIDDPKKFRDELFKAFHELNVFGRIYVAHEGINAQVSVPEYNLEKFRKCLDAIDTLKNIRLNRAINDNGKSFWVLKIKVRDKIVADGITDPVFNMYKKGKYVNAGEMNAMMKDPATIVIDMRNHYEYEVGHFNGAVEIPSDTFRGQLPMVVDMMKDKKENNIIMYCTGGIRCEKASAWMLHNGFNNVFHLEGGIINYAQQTKENGIENKFIGKNFVFDERLGERITDDIIAHCHQCGKPADTHVNCVNSGCHLLFIQCGDCRKIFEGCCSTACRDILHLPPEEQKKQRAGVDKGRNVFNKSKARLKDLK